MVAVLSPRLGQRHAAAHGRVGGVTLGPELYAVATTGTLAAMPRSHAERLVSGLGAEAASSVTRKITYVVAGADLLVATKVRAILNFAPAQLSVPHDVALRNVNLSLELEALSFTLADY